MPQGLQGLGAAAHARWCQRIVAHHVEPLARGDGIVGAPGRQRQQFARGVAIGAIGSGCRLKPLAHRVVRRGLHRQASGTNAREILFGQADAAVGCNCVVELHGCLGIAGGDFSGGAHQCQRTIALRATGGDLVECSLGVGMLVVLGKRDSSLECRPGLGGLLGFQIFIAAPAADAGDDQDSDTDNEKRISLPDLLDLLAAQFFVNFIK